MRTFADLRANRNFRSCGRPSTCRRGTLSKRGSETEKLLKTPLTHAAAHPRPGPAKFKDHDAQLAEVPPLVFVPSQWNFTDRGPRYRNTIKLVSDHTQHTRCMCSAGAHVWSETTIKCQQESETEVQCKLTSGIAKGCVCLGWIGF